MDRELEGDAHSGDAGKLDEPRPVVVPRDEPQAPFNRRGEYPPAACPAPNASRATFAVYLATRDEELCDVFGGLRLRYRPGVQCTQYPCELLWGPGSWCDLLPELSRLEDPAVRDRVEYLDRIFVVRLDGEEVDDPRSPADFASCAEPDGSWVVVRADYPGEAFRHVRGRCKSDAAAAGRSAHGLSERARRRTLCGCATQLDAVALALRCRLARVIAPTPAVPPPYRFRG